jgi:cell division initiation protein
MTIHKFDLLHPVFSQSFMGYATAEVDEFLQEIAENISNLSADKISLADKVAKLEADLEDCAAREQNALKILSSQEAWSREKIDAAKTRIKQEATLVIKDAKKKAENIIQQGNLRLARIMDELAEAENIKTQLEEKLKAIQLDILTLLDKISVLPANNTAKQAQQDEMPKTSPEGLHNA